MLGIRRSFTFRQRVRIYAQSSNGNPIPNPPPYASVGTLSILCAVNRRQQTSRSVRQTERIAANLAQTLVGGECVALYGDLGAGKTQFTRGLVEGLGGDPHSVSSPTFVLLNVYDSGRLKVFHL